MATNSSTRKRTRRGATKYPGVVAFARDGWVKPVCYTHVRRVLDGERQSPGMIEAYQRFIAQLNGDQAS